MEDNAAGHAKMEDIVKKRLQEPESKLVLLPESAFTYAVQQFVNKNESKAIANFITEHLETTRKELTKDTSLDVDSGALNTSSGEKELIHLLEKKNEKINKNLKKKIQKEKKKNGKWIILKLKSSK